MWHFIILPEIVFYAVTWYLERYTALRLKLSSRGCSSKIQSSCEDFVPYVDICADCGKYLCQIINSIEFGLKPYNISVKALNKTNVKFDHLETNMKLKFQCILQGRGMIFSSNRPAFGFSKPMNFVILISNNYYSTLLVSIPFWQDKTNSVYLKGDSVS